MCSGQVSCPHCECVLCQVSGPSHYVNGSLAVISLTPQSVCLQPAHIGEGFLWPFGGIETQVVVAFSRPHCTMCTSLRVFTGTGNVNPKVLMIDVLLAKKKKKKLCREKTNPVKDKEQCGPGGPSDNSRSEAHAR